MPNKHTQRALFRNLLLTIVPIVVLASVVPRFVSYRQIGQGFRGLHDGWLIAAVVVFALTYLLAGLVYRVITGIALPLSRTTVVQLATMFTNRLLPAGSGALGMNYRYLRRQGMPAAEALAAVTTNNLLGVAAHLALLAAVLVLQPVHLAWHFHLPVSTFVIIVILVCVAAAVLLVLRLRLRHVFTAYVVALLGFRRHPARLVAGFMLSVLLTSAYAVSLLLVCRAFGHPIAFAPALIVLTSGVIASTATPTPGGLGGAEAGFAAGLVAIGINSAHAVAITLAFRLATYWLGFVCGAVAFIITIRKRYV